MRTYMKPVMESEAFVANEFITNCWTMSCSCGSLEYYSVDGNEPGLQKQDGTTIYNGEINGKEGCDSITMPGDGKRPSFFESFYSLENFLLYWFWDWYVAMGYNDGETIWFHNVSTVHKWTVTTNHPNASV